jgi:hypothetical protein
LICEITRDGREQGTESVLRFFQKSNSNPIEGTKVDIYSKFQVKVILELNDLMPIQN